MAATSLVPRFSRRFLRETLVFPYQAADASFRLVVADPTDAAAIRAAEIVLGGPVDVEVASFEDIETVLAGRLGDDDAEAPEHEAARGQGDDDIESLRDLASGAPVVRAVNDLLEKAIELRATDIHIEPFRTGLVVRMRVDGLLRAMPAPAGVLPQALISRIKILAGLNIAERRLPQDGAARLRIARTDIDVRVATMPTQHGESAVIRLLPKDRGLLDIAKLGLSRRDESRLSRLLKLPHGMIVVTGPTGSGKTTTLATMLTILNETTRKILTIEDPVEYEIHGVNQSQVKPDDRPHLRGRHALVPAPRSRRDHGGRGARCRNRAYRDPRRADRTSRADHAAHRDRRGRGAAPARSRGRELPAAVDPARRDRAAAGAHPVRPLQGRSVA